jgi:hypothetical protein
MTKRTMLAALSLAGITLGGCAPLNRWGQAGKSRAEFDEADSTCWVASERYGQSASQIKDREKEYGKCMRTEGWRKVVW